MPQEKSLKLKGKQKIFFFQNCREETISKDKNVETILSGNYNFVLVLS